MRASEALVTGPSHIRRTRQLHRNGSNSTDSRRVGHQASGSCGRSCSFPPALFFDNGFFSLGPDSETFELDVLSICWEIIFFDRQSDSVATGAWSPWAEGGVVRREGDEIRLVAVLDQVVFRCVRIVLFGTWFGTEEALVLTLRNFPLFFPEQECATSSA